MNSVTIFEFGLIAPPGSNSHIDIQDIPERVFLWLETCCLKSSAEGEIACLRLTQRHGRKVIQVTSFVGVLRAPNGFQIEVLPKIGKAISGGPGQARKLLIEMLRSLDGFRHIQTDSAKLSATRMPLLEVFINEFLIAVDHVVKRGVRSDYSAVQDDLFALRGKLLVSQQIRRNLFRADRFFTEHDEFSPNRPENRLIHSALRRALSISSSQGNQKFARELSFVFSDITVSSNVPQDFKKVRIDRGMSHYGNALAWARLVLEGRSPLTGSGSESATSLLFPMEAVFESYVAKYLSKQLANGLTLKTQAQSRHLVQHNSQSWFRLKPDLLVRNGTHNVLVLDTKWKLLDSAKANGREKYGLSQSDFYQLFAYGQNYLSGTGDIVLIYPKNDSFVHPLPEFRFSESNDLRLWVLPFCLESRKLLLPEDHPLHLKITP